MTQWYAVLDERSIVVSVEELDEGIVDPRYIPIATGDLTLVGKYYNGEEFVAAPFHLVAAHDSEEISFGGTDKKLTDAVNEKSPANHTHTAANIGAAPANHTHDYAASDHTHTPSEIGAAAADHTHNYAAADHNHDSAYAAISHTHNYAAASHNHDADYAEKNHNHDTAYAEKSHTHDYAAPNHTHTPSSIGAAAESHTHTPASIGAAAASHTHNYAAATHTHDERYYTEAEVDTALDAKAPANHTHTPASIGAAAASHTHSYSAADHNHDARYYTEAEVNSLLSAKAASDHTHSYENLTDKPASLPANGGNADTVDGKHASDFAAANTSVLWNKDSGAGGYYMTEGHTVTPSKPLSQCRTGWLLVWSDYETSTSQCMDYDFACSIIPKFRPDGTSWSGQLWLCQIPNMVNESSPWAESSYIKALRIHNTKIVGHVANNQGGRNDIVLRAVYEI